MYIYIKKEKKEKEKTKTKEKKRNLLHHLVQRSEGLQHALNIMITKIQSRGLLQGFMPHLVPENSDSDELLGHQQGLLDQDVRVLTHAVEHRQCPHFTSWEL